jgi:hypothetical protein
MYAATGNSGVYHSVRSNSRETYCGLTVNKLLLDRPVGNALHFVKDRPPGRSFCKHCSRMKGRERDWEEETERAGSFDAAGAGS